MSASSPMTSACLLGGKPAEGLQRRAGVGVGRKEAFGTITSRSPYICAPPSCTLLSHAVRPVGLKSLSVGLRRAGRCRDLPANTQLYSVSLEPRRVHAGYTVCNLCIKLATRAVRRRSSVKASVRYGGRLMICFCLGPISAPGVDAVTRCHAAVAIAPGLAHGPSRDLWGRSRHTGLSRTPFSKTLICLFVAQISTTSSPVLSHFSM